MSLEGGGGGVVDGPTQLFYIWILISKYTNLKETVGQSGRFRLELYPLRLEFWGGGEWGTLSYWGNVLNTDEMKSWRNIPTPQPHSTTTNIQADVIQYFLIAPKTISSVKCLACRLRRGESQRKQFSEEMIKYLLQSDRSKWKCKWKREKQRSFSQGEMIQGQP